MKPVPSADLRTNRGTWAIPSCLLPHIARDMLDLASPEPYDPTFRGQYLQTTYFDTAGFDLRKARVQNERYLTLRIRRYAPAAPAGGDWPQGVFALSAKTETGKFRVEISPAAARAILREPTTDLLGQLLPADLMARVFDITTDDLGPVVVVSCVRYAVEDETRRLTLDVDVQTDTGRKLPYHVLEFKSTSEAVLPSVPGARPLKLSKFTWATQKG